MKRIILAILATLSILIIYSCKDYDFQNPIDPNITPANPNGLQVISFSEDKIKVSWVDNEELPVGTKKVVQFEYGFNGTDFTIAGYDTVENNEAELSTWFHCDTTYTFRISLYYGGNKTGSTSTIKRKLILQPTNLSTVFDSDTTATLTWKDNSTFEKEYEIEVLENGNSVLIKTVPANNITAVIKWNYLIGKTYSFKVRGKSELNNSNYVTVSTSFSMNAPTNLQITNFIESEAVLTWTDNSSNETSFEIERSQDGTNFTTIQTVGSNITTVTIGGPYLITNQYSFRVRTKTNINYSGYSNIVKSTIQFNAPTNLQVTSFTETTIVLSWQDNSSYETGFELEKSENGSTYTLVKTVNANTTTATIDGSFLTTNQYSFKVRAKTNINYSTYSNIVTQNLQFNAPSNLQIASFTETQAVLTWVDNSIFETSFEIEKSDDGTTYSTVKTVGANIKTAAIDGIFNTESFYYFRIIAKSLYNSSSPSNIAVAGFRCGTSTIAYEGTTYGTVKIGTKCWLKENLNVGTIINDNAEQSNNSTIEKYCHGNNEEYCTTYGGLYQWAEAVQYQNGATNTTSPSPAFTGNVKGICPTGWHIPTLTEFETLSAIVGSDGNALKAIGQGAGSGAGTNTSGFSALLAGYRLGSNFFAGLGYGTRFWGSTEHGTTRVNGLYLDIMNSNIIMDDCGKEGGYSIRCLKD